MATGIESPQEQDEPFPFLSLPAELRHHVYQLVYDREERFSYIEHDTPNDLVGVQNYAQAYSRCNANDSFKQLAVGALHQILVNKQYFEEALPIAISNTELIFNSMQSLVLSISPGVMRANIVFISVFVSLSQEPYVELALSSLLSLRYIELRIDAKQDLIVPRRWPRRLSLLALSPYRQIHFLKVLRQMQHIRDDHNDAMIRFKVGFTIWELKHLGKAVAGEGWCAIEATGKWELQAKKQLVLGSRTWREWMAI